MNKEEIMQIIPHRNSMLLIDEATKTGEKTCTGKKTIVGDEWFLDGHFPGHPIMPGVLILEAMAQVGGVAMLYPEENRGKIAMFGGMENIKFKRPVVPGDQLVTKAHVVRVRGEFGLLHCDGYVDDQLVASADFKFAMKRESEM